MCGITGFYLRNKIKNSEERIHAMNTAIEYRGPDAAGIYVDNGNIALGHRRLSIIDTSESANQPMKLEEIHLVFNGEIYNFNEIKKELSFEFKTHSDTEVILVAVKERGLDWFLKKANGMFSIAIYNKKSKELIIVRDRLGIKPLFYYHDDEKLIFSSEIKAILSSGLVRAEFNDLAVDEYLANRYIRAPYTFFKDICQVLPGTYIKFNENLEDKKTVYWELPSEFNTDEKYDETALLNQFESAVTKAIKYRLMADVPLGTYLSGGVDSSLITAVTSQLQKESINTYTIGFPELNEFEYSKIIAKKYNTNHHELLMSKDDYVNNWENLIGFKDAPLGVPNEIPLAVMSTKLKQKITVVLSGEGADELMGGYGKIYRSPFEFENYTGNLSFYDYFISKYEYVPRKMRDALISTPKEYRQEFDEKIKKNFEQRSNEENVFKFFHEYHVKGLLARVDMTTMQASVEARVPFLDHKLIEFSYSKIPYNLKLKWISESAKKEAKNIEANVYSEVLDTPKYLLRKLSYKYLPEEIVDRKKVGFPVPLSKWFENLEELASQTLPKATWLKEGVYKNLILQSRKEQRAGQILWMFINIELFKQKYFSKEWRW